MAINLEGFVTWLKGWFYEKSEVYKKEETYSKTEVNNALSGKLNSNLVTANKMLVTGNDGDVELADKPVIPDVSGKIDTAGSGLSKTGTTLNHSNSVTEATSLVFKKIKYDAQGHITATSSVSGNDLPSHTHGVAQVTDSTPHSNLGTNAYANQGTINTAIDTAIGNLQSIKAIEVVSTLPTASSSTMGKLYIVSENSKINVYYTEQSGSTYSWHKMDADILDELVVNWSDVQGRPTKTSDFTNDGADGSHIFVSDNDSRLSDARTPTSHTHGQITNDGKITSSAVTVASDDNIVVTDTSDSSKVKRVANLLASQIKDANAHVSGIGSAINDTQATINTKIDTELANLDEKLAERKVFYVDQSDLPSGTSDWGYEELYLVYYTDYTSSPYQSEWRIYYWANGAFGNLEYVSLAQKSDLISSISLVPKSTDANGKIIFYTGDEPT